MKITSFNPLIVTNNSEAAVKLFEDLGFEVRHTKTGINDSDITDFRMRYESEDGKVFHVDIAHKCFVMRFKSIKSPVIAIPCHGEQG